MPDNDPWSYIAAGFDDFLSRSIDNNPQANLDARGLPNYAVAFDRTQVSGALGDTLRLGNILLDGSSSRIVMNDGSNDVLLIGEDS